MLTGFMLATARLRRCKPDALLCVEPASVTLLASEPLAWCVRPAICVARLEFRVVDGWEAGGAGSLDDGWLW